MKFLANFINALSVYVDEIDVYSTYGNHARTIQNKEDSIHADNMERIIPWWLKQRLKDNKRVNIVDSDYHEFIYFNVCGYDIVCTHGDLDKFKDDDYICLGPCTAGGYVYTSFTKREYLEEISKPKKTITR